MIDEIFLELKALGQVQSETEFSQVWLASEGSYASVLKSKGRRPSAKALSACATKLVLVSDPLLESVESEDVTKGMRMRRLAQQCVNEMLPAGVRVLM